MGICIAFVLILTVFGAGIARSANDCNQKFYGCSFDDGQCKCEAKRGVCVNPFQYDSRKQCLKAEKFNRENNESQTACDKKVFGCYYEHSDDRCYCQSGCITDRRYRFQTEDECMKKMSGDQCKSGLACLNKGKCIPLKRGKFRCNCLGTTSYGKRCQKKCPHSSFITLLGMQTLYEENQDWWQSTQMACLF